MKFNLKILGTAFVSSEEQSDKLEEKILVKNMMIRRRLTRGAKVAIYLASKVGYKNEKIIFGSAYGEVRETVNIVKSIYHKTALSPTSFQNSVHNTPVSYLSILSGNESEITTVSDLYDTSLSVLKVGAVKAFKGSRVLLLNVDSFFFDEVKEMNKCNISMMEAGVGMLVEITTEKANIHIKNKSFDGISPSLWLMLEIYEEAKKHNVPIVEVDF